MIDLLQRIVAQLMNSVRVNHVHETTRDAVPLMVKRRRLGGSIAVWLGNRFLALTGSGNCMFVRTSTWMNWEIDCAQLLYPERPVVKCDSRRSVIMPKVSGSSLRQLLQRREPALPAFVAAGRELRRVHQLPCAYYNAAWSHGDLHLDNMIYDSVSDRITLIDFDTRHERSLSEQQRQSDDLTIVLLELVGLRDDHWATFAAAFIASYGEASVLSEVSRRMVVPRGIAKILWFTRTSAAPVRQSESRMQQLRDIIDRIAETKSAVER